MLNYKNYYKENINVKKINKDAQIKESAQQYYMKALELTNGMPFQRGFVTIIHPTECPLSTAVTFAQHRPNTSESFYLFISAP